MNLPLATYFNQDNHQQGVLSKDITAALHMATVIMGNSISFTSKEVLAHSLQACGAMALLCADVNPDIIHLLSHWKSDTMF